MRDECTRGGEATSGHLYSSTKKVRNLRPAASIAARSVPVFRRGRRPARLAVAVLAEALQSPPHRSCARASSLSSFAMGRDDADDDRPGESSTTSPIDLFDDSGGSNAGAPQLTREASERHVLDAAEAASSGRPFDVLNLRGHPDAGAALDVVLASGRPLLASTLNLEFGLRVDDARVARLARCGTLRRVNLNAAQDVGDVAVAAIAANNPNLREMSLYWNVRVTDTAVVHLCAACPRLERVNLSGCKRLTDASARAVAALPTLTRLDLTRCAFTDDGLNAILLSPGPSANLTHLILYAAQGYTDRSHACVSALPKLECLDLCGSQTLTDRALVEIAEGCPNLRRLNVSWCTKLTDEGLIAVARGCPRLEWLSVHGNVRVTGAFARALADSNRGTLRALDVCGCVGVEETRERLREMFPALVEFVLHT